MALRDQPYFPLYVQDFLTDEKLNNCSASSQGVYIKIMCVLHKQENYGQFLFKQKHKQKSSMTENFALMFARQLPFDYETILNALTELVDEGVLKIEGEILSQKRMVKDFEISSLRSEAAKKGGGNPNLFKQKPKQPFKQKPKQNTENEIEYENESVNDIENKKEKAEKQKTHPEFSNCMEVYFNFMKTQTGASPRIGPADGRALKEIIIYLEKFPGAQSGEKSISQLFEYILMNIKKWDAFHQKGIKLIQINSNLENIINRLKNGNPSNSKDYFTGRLSRESVETILTRPIQVID